MIERSTDGLIEHQFAMLDKVADEASLSIEKQVAMAAKLVNGIRGIAALNLAHMREAARAPEFAARGEQMQLVQKKKQAKK